MHVAILWHVAWLTSRICGKERKRVRKKEREGRMQSDSRGARIIKSNIIIAATVAVVVAAAAAILSHFIVMVVWSARN